MKRAGTVVKLVFGALGVIYTAIGAVMLMLAVKAAGDIRRIFNLPEDELALAIVGTVFSVLGVIFLLVTLILLLASRRQKRLREELLQYGVRVMGTIVDVRVDYAVRVNGHSPLVAKVRCYYPTGEAVLKSKRLWSVCPATGDQVEVIYDPMDERRYVIVFPAEN